MAFISRLRKEIEEEPGNPRYIQTVKGIGYRFNAINDIILSYEDRLSACRRTHYAPSH